MQVLITGKHLEITDLMKQHIEESFSGIFADKTLKVSTIRVLVEFEKSRSNFRVSANVSMKNRDVTTQVDNHDMYKAIADAVEKIRSQVEKYLDKVQDHSHEPLRNLEPKQELES